MQGMSLPELSSSVISSAMKGPGLLPDSDSGLDAIDKQNLKYQYTTARHYNSGTEHFHRTDVRFSE
jgi:hypothetical protein